MSKPKHTFNKRQREKDKQKKMKEKKEKMDDRKQERANSGSSGVEIDWGSAPVNVTLNNQELLQKEIIQEKNMDV